MSTFTSQQSAAIQGAGNLLVVAGAGTGKTHTLIARCLRLILAERVSVENILMVTFTEAAAAEMRGRLRAELLKQQLERPEDEWLAQQLALLDTAAIGTLHSFCLQLAREHFHELGLDPQFNILDESQTRPLQRETLDELFEKHYTGHSAESAAVQQLIRGLGRGADAGIRKLVLKLHGFAQSLPDPDGWLTEQTKRFVLEQPDEWRSHFATAVKRLAAEWRDELEAVTTAVPAIQLALAALRAMPIQPDFSSAAKVIQSLSHADDPKNWPYGTKTKFRNPLKKFFAEVEALAELLPSDDADPLAQDWAWARQDMLALLQLVREFSASFASRKREFGGVDFSDLEQCALRLLRDERTATEWRERFAHIFVDEYQDINAAQDAILTMLSRPGSAGNRFLVGDVKQSIYRFRRANPHIFQNYEAAWRSCEISSLSSPKGGEGRGEEARSIALPRQKSSDQSPSPQPSPRLGGERVSVCSPGLALSLTENFRSRQAILDFVNSCCGALMRPEIGGVSYEPLQFGAPEKRGALANQAPRVELVLIAKADETDRESNDDETEANGDAAEAALDLLAVECEARLVVQRLKQLRDSSHEIWDKEQNCFRAVEWSDMAVLLRSPSGRAEAFAKEFSRLGVPLNAARDGFFASLEVSDLLNLLRLLDNPLQDVPLAAVLRSPLVGLTLDEMVEVRLVERGDLLWVALTRVTGRAKDISAELRAKVVAFLEQFQRWRELARQTSLSQTLETALNDTHYEALLLAGPRGVERVANVRRLLDLARQFDPYQRQGLYRFLRFVRLQEDEELDLEPAAVPTTNAVRLLSVHRSKGLEFPVVALAGLGTNFNEQDRGAAVLLDEQLGLCPKITPPGADQSYPSLPHRLANQNERRELRGEELRLLYVALTRARDTLLLVGSANELAEKIQWEASPGSSLETKQILAARSQLQWLRLWLPLVPEEGQWQTESRGANDLLTWEIITANDPRLNDHSLSATETITPEQGRAMPNEAEFTALKKRLAWRYPHELATREVAKTSVTALRRRAADEADDEARPLFRFGSSAVGSASNKPSRGKLSAAEFGIAHHTFLQYVAIERTVTELDLRNEAVALLEAGVLTQAQVDALNFGDLTAFWQSETGLALRKVFPNSLNREMEFTARLTAGDLKQLPALRLGGALAADDFIVVQGQVDLAVLLPEEIWLLDFKTDAVTEVDLAGKVKEYAPQLEVYACALEKIYNRPVTRCWLHFLRARQTVEL
jgi:ATP-dependent helicase/nuclease subunit A